MQKKIMSIKKQLKITFSQKQQQGIPINEQQQLLLK